MNVKITPFILTFENRGEFVHYLVVYLLVFQDGSLLLHELLLGLHFKMKTGGGGLTTAAGSGGDSSATAGGGGIDAENFAGGGGGGAGGGTYGSHLGKPFSSK